MSLTNNSESNLRKLCQKLEGKMTKGHRHGGPEAMCLLDHEKNQDGTHVYVGNGIDGYNSFEFRSGNMILEGTIPEDRFEQLDRQGINDEIVFDESVVAISRSY